MLSRYREPLRGLTAPVGQVLVRMRLRPNHLTLAGLGVSLLAAAAFVTGRTRTGGVLLVFAGLFDFFDGSLARASGQVTPFGGFLDSVIDRYSDLVVLLGIVVLFASMPHARGALVAMAALVGSVMVSYTKARAESIGVECTVGMMERAERMICVIAGAMLDLLEPAMWVLAVLANLTALQRIAFTWRATRRSAVAVLAAAALGVAPALAGPAPETPAPATPSADADATRAPVPAGSPAATPPSGEGPGLPPAGDAGARPAERDAAGEPAVSGAPAGEGAKSADTAGAGDAGTAAPTDAPAEKAIATEGRDATDGDEGGERSATAPAEGRSAEGTRPERSSAPAEMPPAAAEPAAPPAVAEPATPTPPGRPEPRQSPARAAESELERRWARAVAAYAAGDPRPALREFATAAALEGVIGDHLGLLLADARARVGDLAGARTVALGVADRHADRRLAPAALVIAATLASRAGDEAGAQAALTRLLGSYPDAAEAAQALYLLGMTGEARGQLDAAAAAYRELQVLAPASAWADGAGDRLAELAARGVRVPVLSLSQRLDRAERLLRGGVAKTASDEAERIAQESPDASITTRALRIVADASARLGRHEVAARALEALAGRSPAARRPALWLEQARLLVRGGRRERALTVLAQVEAHGTESEAAEAAYQRARILDDLERHASSAAAYNAVVSRYPNREVAGASLWRLGWLAHAKGDVRGAERAWLKLSQIPGGRSLRLAALYWTGRMREQTAGRAAAAALYRRVLAEAPRSYYGMLAAQRATATGPVDSGPVLRLPADPRQAIGSDPGFVRVELLRRLGLVEAAVRELEDVVLRSVGDPVRLYGLSDAFVREERYHLALRILRRHFAVLASTGHDGLPRAFWEMLYPLPWREEIGEAAERNGVDPHLVAAVVREESSYYPRAVSRAGARGLMQLMPATAQPMAEHRGLPFRDGDLLDDPRANLQLGAAFLGTLLREWGDARLALAAYNAGPRRVREWWKARRTDDVEAFVELIPFDETRLYVKRVMLSWAEYRRLYEADRDTASPSR